MDDLAPVTLLRQADECGRNPDDVFHSRKKLQKKASMEPDKEPSPDAEKHEDHELDILA